MLPTRCPHKMLTMCVNTDAAVIFDNGDVSITFWNRLNDCKSPNFVARSPIPGFYSKERKMYVLNNA